MNIKLTKKEKDFLISWLSDDLDLALKDKEDKAYHMGTDQYGINNTVKVLSSIVKKLKLTK